MIIIRNGQSFIPVYLAGGFHSDWQQTVINECRGLPFLFLNPKKNYFGYAVIEQQKEAIDLVQRQSPWWFWDKLAIKIAEVIFLYCEKYRADTRIRGVGDIFEAGIGWAYDKLVIFVNEVDHRYYRGIARNFLMFETLQEGIKCLKSGAWLLDFTAQWEGTSVQ